MTDLLRAPTGQAPDRTDLRLAAGAPRPATRRARVRPWWVMAVLAVGAVVARLPYQADVLVNFDAVNFALGVDRFDLAHHQPHPPGYLGYVVLVRPVAWLVDDANRALTLVSVMAAGCAVGLLFLLANRFGRLRSAAVAALLFGLSPLAWYYGVVGLSYLPGAAVAIAVAWAAYVARFDGSHRHAYLAVALLALLGALRQTDMVLLAPLVVFATARFPRAVQLRLLGLAGALTAVWLVPLLLLSGGPTEYLAESRDLAVLAGHKTSVFGLDPAGLGRNVALVAAGTVLGTFAALVPLALTWRRGMFERDERRFLLAWIVPPLVVYLLVHTGQVGYVLLVVPAAYLVLARGLDRWSQCRSDDTRHRVAGAAALAVLVGVDVLGFGVLPGAIVDLAERRASIATPFGTVTAPDPRGLRSIDVESNDTHWQQLIDRLERTDPRTTAVVTVVRKTGSFRHLGHYLPDHRIHALGQGLDGDYGHLFTAHDGSTDYRVDGLDHPDPVVELPDGIRDVVVLDHRPSTLVTDLPSSWEELADGTQMLTIRTGGADELRVEAGPPVRLSTG